MLHAFITPAVGAFTQNSRPRTCWCSHSSHVNTMLTQRRGLKWTLTCWHLTSHLPKLLSSSLDHEDQVGLHVCFGGHFMGHLLTAFDQDKMANQQPPSLMTLPAELRLKIYHHILTSLKRSDLMHEMLFLRTCDQLRSEALGQHLDLIARTHKEVRQEQTMFSGMLVKAVMSTLHSHSWSIIGALCSVMT